MLFRSFWHERGTAGVSLSQLAGAKGAVHGAVWYGLACVGSARRCCIGSGRRLAIDQARVDWLVDDWPGGAIGDAQRVVAGRSNFFLKSSQLEPRAGAEP